MVPEDYNLRIRQTRDLLGLTQAAFASRVGVSFVTVSRWENRQSKPSRMAWRVIEGLAKGIAGPDDLGPLTGPHAVRESPIRAYAAPSTDFTGDPATVQLVVEAERLSFGHLANPAFGIETSMIDPLPHQRLAVYEHMLPQPRLRFLLADDAGAGKTIMSGLYIREMLARRLIRRILIIPPAGLIGNWQRELRTLLNLDFRIVRGFEAKGENPFFGAEGDRVICSVDTLAGERVFGCLKEEGVLPYDLVIFDEAHKLSAHRDPDYTVRKTERYCLAEALAGIEQTEERWALPWRAQHLLLLTATPHMGKDFPYYSLWRLLEPEVLPTMDAFSQFPPAARVRHFLRRTKEEMVRFDGTPLFPRRESNTLSYDLSRGADGEQELYDRTTEYMRTFYNRARILNRSAAQLAMSVFQRRLASSTYALKRSFDRRVDRLDSLVDQLRDGRVTGEQLQKAQRRLDLGLEDPFDRTADEDATEDGRERHELDEEKLLGVVLAHSLAELQTEREEVKGLLTLADRVLAAGGESKFEKLREVLTDPRFRGEKCIIFTEHRDTLEWLGRRLEALGFTDQVARIHGGMDFRRREDQVEHFRRPASDGGAQYLIATDAAGEGINLQFCWLMANWDIPWNPARLEQRMGRIHRYGQKHDPVIITNLVAGKTREGRVLQTLLEKLERIRKEMRSDKVFDVVGRLFENVSMADLMAAALTTEGAERAQSDIEGLLTPDQVKALADRERHLFGDGGDVKRELPRLRSQIDIEVYRRLLPGHVRHFISRVAPALGLGIDGDLDGFFSLRPVRRGVADPLWSALDAYPDRIRSRLTVYRPADRDDAIFLHPGELVFERLRNVLIQRFAGLAQHGAVLVDPTVPHPYMVHLAEVSVLRRPDPTESAAADEILECRLVGVRHGEALRPGEAPELEPCPLEQLLLLRGGSGIPQPFAGFATTASESIVRVEQYLTERIVGPMVAERQHELVEAIPERDLFLVRGYNSQDAELAAARARLGEKARTGNAAARSALELVKEQQRSLAARKERALTDLRQEPGRIAMGPIRMIAHVLVVPSADPEDRKRHDADVEAIAMQVAQAHEEARGASVTDVSTPPKARAAGLADNPGFDLLSTYPGGGKRAIEVKGRAEVGDIEVTENEWAKACNLRDGYWLYAVLDCATPHPRLSRVQDPFLRLLARAKGSVIINASDVLAAASGDYE